MKRAALIFGLLFFAAAAEATVTNVQTRPSGASGAVQFNNGGVFGSSPTFTYDKTTSDLSVSTVSVTFIDGSTATMRMIRWADGTTQTTAAGSGSYITLTSVLQDGATFYVSSGTVNTLNIGTAIRFPDGSLQITAGGGGGGGGYWIGTATSALNMGGLYAVYGATNVTTSTLTVTGATVSFNGATYVLPSSTSFAGDSKLLVYTLANGTVTATPQSVIIDGMRKSSTDTVTAAKVFQSSVTLPTIAQVTTLDATGEIAVQTNAYTANGSSGTLVYYVDGQRYYVVATTSPVISNSHFPVFNRTTNRWEISSSSFTSGGGGGGSGTPGGSDTQFQFNNASSFGGVVPATYSVTTGQITFSSAVTHVNVSSVTYNNANIVMGTNAKIYWADGTVQVSSPSSSGGGSSGLVSLATGVVGVLPAANIGGGATSYIQLRDTLQTGATFYVSSGSVAGPLTVINSSDGNYIKHSADTAFGPKGITAQILGVEAIGSGGTYRIAVSTRTTLPTTQTAGQTEVKIRAPGSSDTGGVSFYVNGVLTADYAESEVSIHQGLTLSNREPLALYNGGQYVTFRGTAAPNQAYDHNYILPSSTGTVGQVLAIDALHSDHVDLGWATVSGGGTGDIEGVTAGTGLQGGGSSGTVVINGDPSVLLFGSSATATYLQLSSATATYLPTSAIANNYLALSSATATYSPSTVIANNYLTQSSATATYLQTTSATATYLRLSSATATYLPATVIANTYLTLSSATATYLPTVAIANNYQPLDATLTDLAAAPLSEDNSISVGAIASGTLPSDVIASSVAAGAVGGSQLSANTSIGSVGITIDGGGSAISTGVKGYVEIPYSGTIEGWTILGDTSGSIVVDVWKDTYANYPPDNSDSIAGTELPTISATTKGQDLALSSWGTTVTAGDVIGFNVDSATTITRATLVIRIRKS